MAPQEFEKLIDKDKYQVFVFVAPGALPVSFALHPWFVVNKKGKIFRWEIIHQRNRNDTSWNYLHKNFLPLEKGTRVFLFGNTSLYWPARLLGLWEGDENSIAKKIADFIENSPQNYSFCNKYRLWGPNSNTYGQWVLDHFPDSGIKLPWNC